MSGIHVINAVQQVPRMKRRPQHPFNLETRPFLLQPFHIAPVMPGETLNKISLKSRVVTKPLAESLVGWWKEYFFFYVKLTDIDPDLGQLFVDPDYDSTGFDTASARVEHFQRPGKDWVKLCNDLIGATFFQDEGSTMLTRDSLPLTAVKSNNWTDSLILESDVTPDAAVGTTEISDLQDQVSAFEQMRMLRMSEMGYADYIKSYGVRTTNIERGEPELLRWISDFTYPSNTINPSDGAPSSACSWSFTENMEKPRFIKEPGFIFGCTVARPKMYMANVAGTLTSRMETAEHWFPPYLMDDASSTIFKHDNSDLLINASALPTDPADEHYYDLRDLLMYGEEFTNVDIAYTDAKGADLPQLLNADRDINKYPSDANVDELFTNAGVSAPENLVYEDGLVSLDISGRQKDMT